MIGGWEVAGLQVDLLIGVQFGIDQGFDLAVQLGLELDCLGLGCSDCSKEADFKHSLKVKLIIDLRKLTI